MSNIKQREYVYNGSTNPLADGIERDITLVAVVTEEVTQDTDVDYNRQLIKGKLVETYTTAEFEIHKGTLSIGLAIRNPIDTFNSADAIRIARGRALKPSKAFVTLTSDQKFFYEDTVMDILGSQLKRIRNNPNKFIKVSAPKTLADQLDKPL